MDLTNTEKKAIDEQLVKVDELLTVRYLTPKNAEFERTEGGFVSLKISEEESYERVNLFRAFPFSDPDRYISVREADTKAREIGIIQELSVFDEQMQEVLREQMNLRYFTPKIMRVYDLKVEQGYAYWDVLTDRGPCKFTMNSGSIPHIADGRLLIVDVDSNRFEIEDFNKLPHKDVKKLDLFL